MISLRVSLLFLDFPIEPKKLPEPWGNVRISYHMAELYKIKVKNEKPVTKQVKESVYVYIYIYIYTIFLFLIPLPPTFFFFSLRASHNVSKLCIHF